MTTNPIGLACKITSLALLSWAVGLSAADIYVEANYIGGGNDGSQAHPYTTVAQGLVGRVSGDVVHVAAGNYAERNLTVTNGVSVLGANRDTVLIGSMGSPQIFSLYGSLSSVSVFGGTEDGVKCFGTNSFLSGCKIYSHADNGVDVMDNGAAVITNCVINGNTHAGVYARESVSFKIVNCDLYGNQRGIESYSDSTHSLEVWWSSLHDNVNEGAYIEDGRVVINYCRVFSNGGNGLTIFRYIPACRIDSSLVFLNRGTAGVMVQANAWCCYGAGTVDADVVNTTIVRNSGVGLLVQGDNAYSGQYNGAITCDAMNSIVWGNGGAELSLFGGSNAKYLYVNNCCVEGGYSGSFNITNNPGFVDFTNNNFHLQASSACIDKGANAVVTTAQDFDGGPRILDGDINGTQVVDMGCYEYFPPGAPVANFIADVTSGTSPLAVHFTDQSTGLITSWMWDFRNDGIMLSTQAAPDPVIYIASGQYSVRLTVSGPGGSNTLVRTNYISVNPGPPVAGFSATPTSGYAPLTATFTDSSSGEITQRLWDFNGDGVFDTTNPTSPITCSYTNSGTYTVKLLVSGPGGTNQFTRTNYITSLAPVANFSASPANGYVPLQVTFTDSSVGTITSRLWDFDNNGIYDATNPVNPVTFTYSQPGTYSPTLAVSGPGGTARLTRTNSVVADPLPLAPVAAFTGSPLSGPSPLVVTFSDQSSGVITNRAWDFQDDGIVDLINPAGTITNRYGQSATYSVRLTVSGPGGVSSLVKTGYVNALNGLPVISVASQQIFLPSLGDMATLDASASYDPEGQPLYFSWREYYNNPYLGLIPSGADSMSKLSLYFPSPGRYQFDVRVSDGKDVSLETRTITVYVPGRKGVIGFSPSDGIVRVPDATFMVYNTQAEAQNGVNPVDGMISDSRGRYVLENVAPTSTNQGRVYYYKIQRPTFDSTQVLQMNIIPDPSASEYRQDEPLGRQRIATMTGTIRSTNNAPIEGAIVSIVPGLGGEKFITSTDPSGNFQLYNVPGGSWIMQLRADGYQPEVRDINVAAGMSNLVYHLSPSTQVSTLSGRVYLLGTDRPVSNAKILLGTGSEKYSDTRGKYSFSNLPCGSYVVTVTQTGYEPLRIPAVVVKPGSNTFDFPISFTSRGPTVRGTVTDRQSGKPIHLTTVGIESSAGLLARSDITDYTGYYSLLDVPTGDQVFRITAQGYQTKRYTNAVTDGLNMNILLDRSSTWSPPAEPSTGAPIARVAQPFIYLSNLAQSALLDASPSTGSGLQFIWRESRDNPGALDLIPAGSESLSQVTIGGFKVPGIYVFEVQVRSGTTVSPNTTATTIFAPGLAGNVHASPSDGLAGLPLATVRAYSAYDDALNWRGNFVDSKATDDNPVGDFSLDGLTAGTYWIVAQAQTGSGYKQYGPVRHRVNHSSAARQLQVNLSKDEYQLSGIITDTDTSMPLENVRMVIMPGSQTESFRTTTDAYGYYRLSAVPKGPQIVMLTKDGYRARVFFFDIPAGNTVFSRTMRRNTASPANLSGMVTADYHGIALPVANAEITLGDGLIRVFTDGSGRYEIRGLPPGDYFGTMRKEGYIPTDLGDLTLFTLLEGDNTIDKTLTFNDHGPVVRGTVIDQNGQPIDGVTISVLQPPAAAVQAKRPPSDGPDPTATVVSDPAGIFQMIGVPHGPRQLQISLPDGTTFTNEVEIYGSLDLVIPVAQATDDADGDGLPDAWEILYFGSIQNASPTDDPDGDRMTNLQEWLAGTVPTNALSRFQFSTVVRQPDGRAVLSWPSVDGRTYSLAWSTNVGITGSFSVLNASIPATPPINTYTDSMHTNSSRGFYQLRLNIVSP